MNKVEVVDIDIRGEFEIGLLNKITKIIRLADKTGNGNIEETTLYKDSSEFPVTLSIDTAPKKMQKIENIILVPSSHTAKEEVLEVKV